MPKLHFLAALLLGISSVPLLSTESSSQETQTILVDGSLEYIDWRDGAYFDIMVLDGVKDGCWTNQKLSENAVELELTRSSRYRDTEKSAYQLLLSANGFDTSHGMCVLHLSMKLYSRSSTRRNVPGVLNVIGMDSKPIYDTGYVLYLNKSEANEDIKNRFVELTQAMLIETSKNRAKVINQIAERSSPDQLSKFDEIFDLY